MNSCHSFLRDKSFDAIVCDPPYGIRATNKVQEKPSESPISGLGKQAVIDHDGLSLVVKPPPEGPGLDPIILATYSLASRVLVEGGRLVHLYHISTSDSYWKSFFDKKSTNVAPSADKKDSLELEGFTSAQLLERFAAGLPPGMQTESLSHQFLAKDRIRCMVTARKVSNTNLNNN